MLEKLNKALNIFLAFQLCMLIIGIYCIFAIDGGAYVFVLFGQTIATIIFGIIISHKTDKAMKERYPHISMRYSFNAGNGGFRLSADLNGPMMAEAKRQNDDLACAVIKKQYAILIMCGIVVFSLGILAKIHYA